MQVQRHKGDDFFIVEDEFEKWESAFQKIFILAMSALIASIFFYAYYDYKSENNFNDRVIQFLDQQDVG